MSSDESTESDFDDEKQEKVVRDFEAEGQQIISRLLPKKSCEKYELVYKSFMDWCYDFKISSFSEEELLVYFKELSKKFKPSTLWSQWSILKTTLQLRHNVNINNFHNLKSFLKIFSKGYEPKKSKVLKLSEVIQFLQKSDDDIYLSCKVILIFGVCGAMRCQELCNLDISDVEDGDHFIVAIRDTKTFYPRSFVIGSEFCGKVRQYISLRPEKVDTSRFFIGYRNGKCFNQVIGKNKIGEVPKTIALYLNLENPEMYTGHTFRRTSATLLSNSGANLVAVKSLGGWKSDAVAQGYIDNSVTNKRKIFEGIIDKHNSFSANKSSANLLQGKDIAIAGPSHRNLGIETSDESIQDLFELIGRG